MAYTRLGDLLLSVGLITDGQLEQALQQQKTSKNRLGKELIVQGIITEEQLIDALVMQLDVEFVDLSKTALDPSLAKLLSKNLARKHGVVPVRLQKSTLYLAMSDPTNFVAVEEVKTATRKQVVPLIATADAIDRAISTLYGTEGAARAIEEMKRELSDSGPVSYNTVSAAIDKDSASAPTVRLVNSIIERAVVERASDIHLEPGEELLRVRMRIDGLMRNIMTVPNNLQASVISRLKIMGGMDITERRLPQDGRCAVRVRQSEADLRMSTLPTIYGEKVVIRLLDKNAQLLDKEHIGLTGRDLEQYSYLVGKTSGVVLIAGPTGSGKSSTLYTMIRERNTEEVNLVTLEDPVEYHISGINQVQINEKTGLSFASGLRSILRQDPDIIAEGEIRDGETAQIAMRAAITGHLVLSTIHTNDALATVDRLLDVGVEPYLIAGALNGVVSQRLVRRICPQCRQAYVPSDEERRDLGLSPDDGQMLYRGTGCPACHGTGVRGRTAVFEILIFDRVLRGAIAQGAKREELEAILAKRASFVPLATACRRLVLSGIIGLEEARRTMGFAEEEHGTF